MEIPIFDLNILRKNKEDNYSIALVGSRKSGKTTFLKYLYNEWIKSSFDLVVFFCENPQASIYDFLDEDARKFVFPSFHPDIIRQMDILQNGTKNFLRICWLFDDESGQKVKHNQLLLQLFIRGRNINSTCLFSTQSLMFIESNSRNNVDLYFIFQNRIDMTSKISTYLLWNLPVFKPFVFGIKKQEKQDFIVEFLKKSTEDYRIVVLSYVNNEEKLMSFKVPNISSQ